MDDNKTLQKEDKQTKSLIDRLNFRNLYVAIILNWKWFIIAVVFCLGIVYIRLRYTTPVYQVSANCLSKTMATTDEETAFRIQPTWA